MSFWHLSYNLDSSRPILNPHTFSFLKSYKNKTLHEWEYYANIWVLSHRLFLLALQWLNSVNKRINKSLDDQRILCHNQMSCHMTSIKVISLLLLVLHWPNLVWRYISICLNDQMILHCYHVTYHATSI